MLEINILGCGSSFGVPIVGCACKICKSDSNYNKRLRSSILISRRSTKVLIDFGFNIKEQLINANIDQLDGAILTHDHADHVGGIDELRIFHYLHRKPLDIYVNKDIAPQIFARYNYLFAEEKLKLNIIDELGTLKIKDLQMEFFPQIHGPIRSLGVKVDDFVYSCDLSAIPTESEKFLKNLKVWIVDCADYKSNSAHCGLSQVLEWETKYKPQKVYLTNMSHKIDYHKIINELPSHIMPCYDNLVIKL